MARPLVIACGALAKDLRAVFAQLGLADSLDVNYLPAPHHSRPERIVPAVREQLASHDDGERPVFIAYGDCGTGGHLDRLLDELGGRASRLPGDHCYEFMAGSQTFAELHDAEPGTFYLTDFLARQFESLIIAGLGLDRHPELRDAYFGNYSRLLYLAQTDDADLTTRAEAAAVRLGLAFERRLTGYGELTASIQSAAGAA